MDVTHCDIFLKMKPTAHRLLLLISSKGSFICTFPQTGQHIPQPLTDQLWNGQYPKLQMHLPCRFDRMIQTLTSGSLYRLSYVLLPSCQPCLRRAESAGTRRQFTNCASAMGTDLVAWQTFLTASKCIDLCRCETPVCLSVGQEHQK